MFIVLGATGHIGSAVAEGLLQAGESVTAVVRDSGKAEELRAKGAAVATSMSATPTRSGQSCGQVGVPFS